MSNQENDKFIEDLWKRLMDMPGVLGEDVIEFDHLIGTGQLEEARELLESLEHAYEAMVNAEEHEVGYEPDDI